MKQSITLGKSITPTTFNLPCVSSAHKRKDGSYYLLLHAATTTTGLWEQAEEGDTLVEEDNGEWRVIKNNNQ